MDKKIKSYMDEIKDELVQLSEYVYHNPEIGLEEYKSSKAHIDLLNKYGFRV